MQHATFHTPHSTFFITHSTFHIPHFSTQVHRSAFTVLELLTTLALLVVVLGLMVSLARYVRSTAADRMTREMLVELDTQLSAYHTRFGAYPPAPDIADDADEATFAGLLKNRYMGVLRMIEKTTVSLPTPPATDRLPGPLTDAWGRPIGYLPGHHPLVGMAPQNRAFFFSAGPDGRYLTRQDNLYSYEQIPPAPARMDTLKRVDNANSSIGGD